MDIGKIFDNLGMVLTGFFVFLIVVSIYTICTSVYLLFLTTPPIILLSIILIILFFWYIGKLVKDKLNE